MVPVFVDGLSHVHLLYGDHGEDWAELGEHGVFGAAGPGLDVDGVLEAALGVGGVDHDDAAGVAAQAGHVFYVVAVALG